MAGHFIDCFAPGVGTEAAVYIEAALSKTGRKVLSRRTNVGPVPMADPATLRWRVQQLREDGGSFLVVEETGPDGWDLRFFRALSATVGGLVVAREHYRRQERRGLATFLSGKTVEIAARDMQIGATTVGGVSLEQLVGTRSVDEVYEERFAELGNTLAFRLREAPVMVAEDWHVSPAEKLFDLEDPVPECWAFLPNLEATEWESAVTQDSLKGWEWRAATVRGTPFVELRKHGLVDEMELSRLIAKAAVAATALELRGSGEAFRWFEFEQGQTTGCGTGSGAQELFRVLHRAAMLVGEGPGMVMGRGTQGWSRAS